jgi:hypothetical protein
MTELFNIKAGRAFRREGTNFVDAEPAKGALVLEAGNDGLLYLRWRTRDGSTSTREDLVSSSPCAVANFTTSCIPIYILFIRKP